MLGVRWSLSQGLPGSLLPRMVTIPGGTISVVPRLSHPRDGHYPKGNYLRGSQALSSQGWSLSQGALPQRLPGSPIPGMVTIPGGTISGDPRLSHPRDGHYPRVHYLRGSQALQSQGWSLSQGALQICKVTERHKGVLSGAFEVHTLGIF